MPAINPFWHGTPVPLEKFIGRDDELLTIASRIRTGQSVAITGAPRSGKTSVLQRLLDPANSSIYYGDNAHKLIFSRLDASLWDEHFSWVQFWKAALHPLYEQIQSDNTSPLYEAYQVCQDNEFGSYVIERLLDKLRADDKQLVLIIDEFDAILHLPLRNSAQFFGGTRSLVINSKGTLAVVVAINTSLSQLTEEIKTAGTGSPYFNYMSEVILTALSDVEIENLLNQGAAYFSKEDCAFIKEMAGGHPYLLQVLASCLWELYERPDALDVKLRQHQATKDFYLKVTDSLERTWRSWPLKSQQDMMAVTFVQLDKLKRAFQRQGINVENLSQQMPRLKSELEALRKQGFVREDEKVAGGWRVYPKIFLHFIIDKKLELKYRQKLPPEVWKTFLTPEFG